MLGAQAVQMRARLTPQMEELLEAGIPDVGDAGAAPLEERVCRDGGAVCEGRHASACGHRARGREHRLLLPRPRRYLGCPDPSLLDEHGVGEGAADVDAQDRHVRTLHRMRVRAFLFDFDGLILDTELASRAGWELLYREHGHELPADLWATLVGTTHAPWDPMEHLEELVGEPLEREALNERRYAHEIALIEAEELRPGIAEYLAAARRHGLKRAIVSSSTRKWIDMHLARLERAYGWDAIVTADHDAQRAKPQPTLYPEALDELGVDAAEAIAFEDSPNGAKAAKAAGIYVVGIPNEVTKDLGLADTADLMLGSLADLPPGELLSLRSAA